MGECTQLSWKSPVNFDFMMSKPYGDVSYDYGTIEEELTLVENDEATFGCSVPTVKRVSMQLKSQNMRTKKVTVKN